MKSKYLYCFGKENFVNGHSNYHCYDYLCHKGTINNKGHNALQELTKKANAEAASMLYGSLYKGLNLGDSAKKFDEKVQKHQTIRL